MARDGQASGGTEMKRKRKESGRRRRESGTRVNCRGNGLSRENTRHLWICAHVGATTTTATTTRRVLSRTRGASLHLFRTHALIFYSPISRANYSTDSHGFVALKFPPPRRPRRAWPNTNKRVLFIAMRRKHRDDDVGSRCSTSAWISRKCAGN